MREILAKFVKALVSAQAEVVCGAPYGQSSPEWTDARNGYRPSDLDTRVGTIDVGIPDLRSA